jgi:hypothetical protein
MDNEIRALPETQHNYAQCEVELVELDELQLASVGGGIADIIGV